MKSNGLYKFGQFRLDAEKLILWHEDRIVPLKPKALETLAALVKHRGELVTKDELMEEVWRDSFVEENSLSRNVHELRKTLKQLSGEKFIETIPRRGYRFAGEVSEIESGNDEIVFERQIFEQTLIEEFSDDADYSLQKSEAVYNLQKAKEKSEAAKERENVLSPAPTLSRFSFSPSAIAAALLITSIIGLAFWRYQNLQVESTSQINSIAVLPLKSFASEPENESLRLRITDALITKLGEFEKVAVRPTNSVLRFSGEQQDAVEAGKALQVDAVLDGRVQSENQNVRITLQLISTRSGEQLWSEQFDGREDEILALQDKISNRLRKKLAFEESERFNRQTTKNNEAYEAYLKGRYLWNQRTPQSYWKALGFFQQSIEADPNFALAYTGIADCYHLLNQRGVLSADEAYQKAETAVRKALELDSTIPEAHTAMGSINNLYYWRFEEAEVNFKRAIELNPNYAEARARYGMLLNASNRFEEAFTQLKEAERLDPTSINIGIYLGANFYFSRQYEQAVTQFQKVLELAPNTGTAYFFLTRIYERTGMFDEAVEAELKRSSTSQPESIDLLRRAYQTGGIRSFWQKQIDLLKKKSADPYDSEYHIASRYALLNDEERALAYIEKNLNSRGSIWYALKVDPSFDSMRSNPKFQELLRKMNFSN